MRQIKSARISKKWTARGRLVSKVGLEFKTQGKGRGLVPSPYSEGTNWDAHLYFGWMPQDGPPVVRICTFQYETLSGIEQFCEYHMLLPICFKQEPTGMNGMNKKTCTRISRVQATTPSSEAAWTKTNKTCLWEKKSNASESFNLKRENVELGAFFSYLKVLAIINIPRLLGLYGENIGPPGLAG